jgi:WD40 repeat protein
MLKETANHNRLWPGLLLVCCGCSDGSASRTAETTRLAEIKAGNLVFKKRSLPPGSNSHTEEIPVALAFSADGKRLLVTSNTPPDGRAVAWSHHIRVVDFAASPPSVRVRELGSINMEFFRPDLGRGGGPAFSADGSKLLSIAPRQTTERAVELVDVLTGDPIKVLARDTSSFVSAIQFSPDGRRMGICGFTYGRAANGLTACIDGVVHVWDLESDDLLLTHRWREGGYRAITFSPDGEVFAAAGGGADGEHRRGQIVVFNVITGKLIARLTDVHEPIDCLAVTPDGRRLVSGDQECEVKIWDIATDSPSLLGSIRLGSRPTYTSDLTVSPDGTVVFAALANYNRGQKAGGLRVIDAATNETLAVLLADHRLPVCNVAISPDGRMLVARDSHGAMFGWDISTFAGDSAE